MLVAPGTTSQTLTVQIVDDTGLPVTGLVAATFPAVSYAVGTNAAATTITLADLAAITTAYASGGVKERSGGYYRLDLPNAALASAGRVTLIGEATGKRLVHPVIDVQQVAADVHNMQDGVINDAVVADEALKAQHFFSDYFESIGDAAWDEILAGHIVNGTAGKLVTDLTTAYTAARAAKIDFLDAAVSGLATLAAQTSQGTTITAIAGYLDTEVAAIKAKTDNLPADPADASDVAGAFATVNTTLGTIAGYIDTEVAAIKAKTDLLTAGDIAGSVKADLVGWVGVAPNALVAGKVLALADADVDEAAIAAAVAGALDIPSSAEIAAELGQSVPVVVISPITGQSIDIHRGTSWQFTHGRQLTITKATGEPWPTTISGWTLAFAATITTHAAEVNPSADTAFVGTVTRVSDSAVYIELTVAETATLARGVGTYTWQVTATSGVNVAVLRSGTVTVR